MVYQLVSWGMGESEVCTRKYADQSARDLLSVERNLSIEEVDLHPLSNQVCFCLTVTTFLLSKFTVLLNF